MSEEVNEKVEATETTVEETTVEEEPNGTNY